MSEIKISELNPAGSELFEGSEGFLNELNDQEMENVYGAATVGSVASVNSASVGSQASISGGQVSVSVGVSEVFSFIG